MLAADISHPIGLFSVTHIIFMAVIWLGAVFFAVFFARKFGYSKKLVWICTFLGLFCEIEKILFFMQETAGGYRLPAEHIPINMCPFQIFFMLALALAENPQKCKTILCYMYPSMIGGGFIGMLIPSVIIQGYHGLTEFSTYRYFFFHGMIIFMGFYLFLSKPIRYTIKSYGTAIVFVFMTVLCSIWVNAFFGWDPTVNFWFIVRPPAENLPVLNLDHGWAIYVLQLIWICLLLFTLCYLPVIIRDMPGLIKKIKEKLTVKKSAAPS